MQNVRIFFFFFIATIIGTLAHECGHYIPAWLFGFQPQIHYAQTSYDNYGPLFRTAQENNTLSDFKSKLWINGIGGPLQTMLMGVIGIIALMIVSKKEEIEAYKTKHLFWITIAYFWSRELMISCSVIFTRLFHIHYRQRSDEYKMFIEYPDRLLPAMIVLFLLSGLTLAWITFGLVKRHRLQLIIFGALGCIVAYPFWMNWIGPLLLPYP